MFKENIFYQKETSRKNWIRNIKEGNPPCIDDVITYFQ